ncbi:MAG: FtsX-like permease family protein [Actinomycetales bacterium]
MSRRLRLGALLRREFAASRGPGILAVVLVLVTSFLLALWPRAVENMLSADTVQTLSASSVALRDPTAEEARLPLLGPGATAPAPWGAMDDAGAAVRTRTPEPLRSALGRGQYMVAVSKDGLCPTADGCGPGSTFPVPGLKSIAGRLAFDPQLSGHVTVTAGRAPAVLNIPPGPGKYTAPVPSAPLEVMASTDTAQKMHWSIGGRYYMNVGLPVQQQAMVLTGTFTAKDPGADYWQLNPSTLHPGVIVDNEHGNAVTGEIYPNPASTDFFSYSGSAARTRLWFPLDPRAATAENAPLLLSQLRAFLNEDQVYAPPPPPGTFTGFLTKVRFSSQAPALLQESVARAGATNAILAMLSSGPLGACMAALALAVRLLLVRRAPALRLAASRGASALQLRGHLALEWLGLGLPAGAAGILLAAAVVPAPIHLQELLLPAGVGVLPALLLGAFRADAGTHGPIRIHQPRRWRRLRLVAEGITVSLAAGTTYLLLQRGAGAVPDGGVGVSAASTVAAGALAGAGVPSSAASAGADPLLAAAPLLLALAVCAVVLRLYPLPLSLLSRRMNGSPNLVGFIGSARALRSAGAALIPVLALAVGLGVVVFSGVLSTTLRSSIQESAKAFVGADMSIHGPEFTPDQVSQVERLPGVQEVAQVTDSSSVAAMIGTRSNNVRLILVDARKLAAVTNGFPAALSPAQLVKLTEPVDGNVPVAASSYLGVSPGTPGTIMLSPQVPITVTALGPAVVNLTPGPDWVLADGQTFNAISPRALVPNLLLLKLAPGTDPAAVDAAVNAFAWPSVTAESPQGRSSAMLGTPLMGGLQAGLLTVIVFIALLCALIVVMTSLANAPARNRLIGLLRTLGFPRSADKSLLAWELVPIATAAVLAGAVLGLVLPWLVRSAVDLRAFTGGSAQPPVTLDARLLGALVGGFVLVVTLAIAAAIKGGRRQQLAAVLKIGGDE